jgi:hypothetical protein
MPTFKTEQRQFEVSVSSDCCALPKTSLTPFSFLKRSSTALSDH